MSADRVLTVVAVVVVLVLIVAFLAGLSETEYGPDRIS